MKIYLIMRICLLFLICSVVQAFATNSYSQSTTLTLQLKNVSIEEVLNRIEEQSEFRFLYNKDLVNVTKKVSISSDKKEVTDILNYLFKGEDVAFIISDRQIVLNRKSDHSIAQQSIKLTGVVKDTYGEPVIGANVVEKGTTNGTITDANGTFSLQVQPRTSLIVSYIGYREKEIPVGSGKALSITLEEDTRMLDEVVVVGYGTVKKSDLTGSVSSIKAEELKKLPMTSLDQGIQGRAAGVQVTNTSGAPGGQVSIRVRGGNSLKSSNEPLYVIDGFPISAGAVADGNGSSTLATNPMATLNPNDIESIEILKDASAAAIYGSRGANGVVLITTKRGRSGKAKVTYDGYAGFQSVAKKLDFMSAEEFAIMANEGAANEGKNPIYGGADPKWKAPAEYRGGGTDWQSLIFRNAITHNHQVGISGGNEVTKFAISGGYFNQEGVIINSNFTRGSVRANVDTKVSSWIDAGLSFTASRTFSNLSSSEGDGGGSSSGAVNGAIVVPPTMPVYNEDGSFTTLSTAPYSAAIGNPYATALLSKDQSNVDRVFANAFVKFNLSMLLKGLAVEVRGGTDYSNASRDVYYPSTVLVGQGKAGVASKGYRSSTSYLNENLVTYQNSFGKHSVNFVGGLTLQSFQDKSSRTVTAGFVNDILEDNSIGAAAGIDGMPRSGRSASTQVSWLGRIGYNYAERYLLTLTGRADGSSKFGKSNKWGFFPSIAGAWRVSEESFMKEQEAVDNLKIRLSYGITGNQNLGSYNSLSSLGQYNYTIGEVKGTGFAPSKIPNSDLKWETTSTFDAGLDIGFLDNQLNLTFDYYNKQTKDLLWDVTIPNSSGFGSIFKNHGELENWGVEASISYDLITGKKESDFTWSTTLMYSMNRNKVVSLPGITPGRTGNLSGHLKIDGSWIEEGYPVGIWYNYKYDGVFQNQEQLNATIVNDKGETVAKHPKSINTDGLGSPKFEDVNKDGKIDKNDWQIIGDPNPDFILSWSNNFTYKNFDLTLFFNGVFGNDVLDLTRGESAVCTPFGNQRKEMLGRWTPENPTSNIPAARVAIHPNLLQSSYLIQDGSFVRLKNVVLGYRFKFNKGIESLRIYASAQNLFTITGYKGFDPEVNSKGQNNLQQGIDYNAYPLSRTYMFGLNIAF